jgi:hypothetical protein
VNLAHHSLDVLAPGEVVAVDRQALMVTYRTVVGPTKNTPK